MSGKEALVPRGRRIVLENRPHHIVQRGHNRQAVFAGDDDFRYYLATLQAWKAALDCKVYAYCLMTNHVHLIVDPGESPRHLGLLMKRVAGRQTRHANRLERRSGTLWGSRFHSSPIETEAYLLACCRYVEMNPVRAGMVPTPDEYPWSSCRRRIGGASSDWLDTLPLPVTGPDASGGWYRGWLLSPVPSGEWDLIRKAVQRNQLTGTDRFVDEVAKKTGRRVEHRGPGRPREETSGTDLFSRRQTSAF